VSRTARPFLRVQYGALRPTGAAAGVRTAAAMLRTPPKGTDSLRRLRTAPPPPSRAGAAPEYPHRDARRATVHQPGSWQPISSPDRRDDRPLRHASAGGFAARRTSCPLLGHPRADATKRADYAPLALAVIVAAASSSRSSRCSFDLAVSSCLLRFSAVSAGRPGSVYLIVPMVAELKSVPTPSLACGPLLGPGLHCTCVVHHPRRGDEAKQMHRVHTPSAPSMIYLLRLPFAFASDLNDMSGEALFLVAALGPSRRSRWLAVREYGWPSLFPPTLTQSARGSALTRRGAHVSALRGCGRGRVGRPDVPARCAAA